MSISTAHLSMTTEHQDETTNRNQCELIRLIRAHLDKKKVLRDIKKLLTAGLDPNFRNYNSLGHTPIEMLIGKHIESCPTPQNFADFEQEQSIMRALIRKGADPFADKNPIKEMLETHRTRGWKALAVLEVAEQEGKALRAEDGSNALHYLAYAKPEWLIDAFGSHDADALTEYSKGHWVFKKWISEAREDGATPLHMIWMGIRDNPPPPLGGGYQDRTKDLGMWAWNATFFMLEEGVDVLAQDKNGISAADLILYCLDNGFVGRPEDPVIDTVDQIRAQHGQALLDKQTPASSGARKGGMRL